MAKAKKTAANKTERELLSRIRDRFSLMYEADRENREAGLLDMRFLHVPGEQWDRETKRRRGKRVAYEFNKLRVSAKRIINDMRSNRPQGKVRGVENDDVEAAEIREGLCRNYWNISDGDTVIDHAAEYQVGAGLGAWRVETVYSHADAFDQDIRITAIRNPFCLYWDPSAQDFLKRDAADWILTDRISKDEFAARYPNAQPVDFEDEGGFDDDDDWENAAGVRVVEYWYKEPYIKRIALLSTGETVELDKHDPERQLVEGAPVPGLEGVTISRLRDSKCHKIKQVIASGTAILSGPNEWAGTEFPFVVCFGESVIVDGKPYWFGIARFAKDAQRSYNISRTAIAEAIASAPVAHYWATIKQSEGNLEKWADAHNTLKPVMLYNPDPQASGPPQRMGGADVPVALIQEAQIASEEIKSVTGIFDSSLGARSNETSGRAIAARQHQAEVVTFNYSDNMAKGVRRTWEIMLDLIPKVIDTERMLRIVGADGADKFVRVNQMQQTPNGPVLVHDLKAGKYDVTVTVGPSFSTRRQEAAEVWSQIGSQNPAVWAAAGDLIIKTMDIPYSEQISERLKLVMKASNPALGQMLGDDQQQLPPEVMAKLAEAEQMMQAVQQQSQLVQQAGAEVEGKQAEVDKAIADLELKKAQFEASYNRQLADIIKRESEAGVSRDQGTLTADRETLSAQVAEAVSAIQQQAADFMTQAAGVIAEMQARTQPVVNVPPPPRIVRMVSQRVNGQLIAVPEYEG